MKLKRSVETWTVEELHKERDNISFPEYQRQARLWSPERKSRLIDSLLRDIDIPKLYFNVAKDGSIEVVDGQQRLWAIWDFLNDEYHHLLNGKAQRFSELDRKDRDTIKNFELQITVFDEADEDYLRELFLRLQLGLLLNTGEKLHATTGKMKDLVFKNLAPHAFVQTLRIPSKRYAKETLCAQICINSFSRAKNESFSRTRYEDLLDFFKEYEEPRGKDLEFFHDQSKTIPLVMDQLWKIFSDRTKELRSRSYILSVFLFFEKHIYKGDDIPSKEGKQFMEFVFKLWGRLKQEISAGFERKNKELYIFETLISSAPSERYQIERRHEKLIEYYSYFKKTAKIVGDK